MSTQLFVRVKHLFSLILFYTIVLEVKGLLTDSKEEYRLLHGDQAYNMRIQENYGDKEKVYHSSNQYHDNNNNIHDVFKRSLGENFPDKTVRKSLSRVCSSFYSNFPEEIQLLDEDWRQALEIVKARKLAKKNNGQGSSQTKTKTKPRPDDDSLNTTDTTYARGKPISKSNSKWGIPNIYVTRVVGRRHGKKVKVTFYVVHYEPITVSTLFEFNHMSKRVGLNRKAGENQTSPVLSKVSKVYFNIDASRCDGDHPDYFDDMLRFVIFSKDIYWSGEYTANIDICRFDKKEGENADGSTKWIDTNAKKVTQKIHTPPYRLLSDPGKTFVIKQGEDPTFDIELQLCRGCRFMIQARLWDHSKSAEDGVVEDGVSIETRHSYNGQDSEVASISVRPFGGPNELSITATVLSESRLNETFFIGQNRKRKDSDKRASNKQSDFDLKATIRLRVKLGSNALSGLLLMWYGWSEENWYNRPLVRDYEFTRSIGLKLPHRVLMLPKNWMKITNYENHFCDEDGNRMGQKYGKNCTISCSAIGADIKSISIKKKQPGTTVPYQSVSQVWHGYTAFVKKDLGRASDDIAGTYQCTVITDNGTIRHADIHLVTSKFTQIENFTLQELENGTSKIELYAVGVAPLAMKIQTKDVEHQEIERLDSNTNKFLVMESLNDALNHAVLFINTTQLYLPSYYLTVAIRAANGGLPIDYRSIQISNHINYVNSSYESKIDESRTGILPTPTSDKVLLQCVATGHQSMQMMITMGGSSERDRIDNKRGTERTVEETDNARILRLFVPPEIIAGDKEDIFCMVTNKYGGDGMYMKPLM